MVDAITRQPVEEERAESSLDDYQGIDLDIQSLVAKFINPIDRYRSHAAAQPTGPLEQTGLTSSQQTLESRCHAFYRIIGLPIITPDGKFYSPGYSVRASDEIQRRQDIFNAIPTAIKLAASKREFASQLKYATFAKSNLQSTILSILPSVPFGQKSFSISGSSVIADLASIKSLEKVPEQVENIPERRNFITTRYKKKDGSELTSDLSTEVYHPLLPLMVDPAIENNLDPKSGDRTVRLAAPFLDHKDAEYERNKYLKRPGLEMLLRLRLKQQNLAEQANQTIQGITLSEQGLTGDVTEVQQREIASALTGTGVDEVDVKQALAGAGSVELYALNDLVRTLKGLVNLYVKAIETIEVVYRNIVWVPLSNEGGPEKGTEVNTTFVIPKGFLDDWEVEKKIRQLEVKAAIAKRQYDIGKTADCQQLEFGDFATPGFQNVNNTYDQQLQEAQAERDKYETDGSNALRTIELISGEISGLGLIDIVAIWIALWSLDVSVLLNLIDDPAVERLSEIVEFKSAQVTTRASSPGNAKAAYETLTERVQTILSYADRLYLLELASPSDEEGGDVPRDQGTF
jgi:hypothetical protein